MQFPKIILAKPVRKDEYLFFLPGNKTPLEHEKNMTDFVKKVVKHLYAAWKDQVGANSQIYIPKSGDFDALDSLASIPFENFSTFAIRYKAHRSKDFSNLVESIKAELNKKIEMKKVYFKERIADLINRDKDWQQRVVKGEAFAIPYEQVRKESGKGEMEAAFTHELTIFIGGARRGYKALYVKKTDSTLVSRRDLKAQSSENLAMSFEQIVKMVKDHKIEVTFALNNALANPRFNSVEKVNAFLKQYL